MSAKCLGLHRISIINVSITSDRGSFFLNKDSGAYRKGQACVRTFKTTTLAAEKLPSVLT